MKFQLFFCTVVTKVNFSPFQSSFANVFVFQTIGNAVTKMTFLLISVEYIFLTAISFAFAVLGIVADCDKLNLSKAEQPKHY